jgi:hypothetical protein
VSLLTDFVSAPMGIESGRAVVFIYESRKISRINQLKDDIAARLEDLERVEDAE